MFGYFPSYALGNIYAAQFTHTMRQEMPNLDDIVREGRLLVIKEWLNNKIHQYGASQTPKEIVERVTGESINSEYLITYLKEKYQHLYAM
jgi:carboxypeptidase Taq